jgi:hypothetical protein
VFTDRPFSLVKSINSFLIERKEVVDEFGIARDNDIIEERNEVLEIVY